MRLRQPLALVVILGTLLVPRALFAQPGVVSVSNSTTALLSGNAVFTGAGEDVLSYKSVSVFVYASHASAASGLSLEFSTDNTNWDLKYQSSVSATTPKVVTVPVQTRYFRVTYTNAGTGQTAFRLQTLYFSSQTQAPATEVLGKFAIDQTTAGTTNGVDLKTIGTVAPAVGNGASSTGTQRVTLASDSTGNIATIGTSVTPGTGAANLGKAEDAGHTTGDTGVFTLGVIDSTNATQRAATGDYAQFTVDHFGTLLARSDHPNRFHCVVAVSTATTIQAVGGSCATPGAGLSLYITDIFFGTSAAAGTAADSFPTLKSGTGGTCGSGTAVIWQGLAAANSTLVDNRTIPIKVAANSELCWIMTTAGSKTLQISGFIAP